MRKPEDGFTLVEMLVVIGILAILLGIAIPNVIRARIVAYDTLAKNTLRVMSKATEVYLALNNGTYPVNMSSLTNATPAYINIDYCGSQAAGFEYACTNDSGGYTYLATPLRMGFSGSTVFQITTGGVFANP